MPPVLRPRKPAPGKSNLAISQLQEPNDVALLTDKPTSLPRGNGCISTPFAAQELSVHNAQEASVHNPTRASGSDSQQSRTFKATRRSNRVHANSCFSVRSGRISKLTRQEMLKRRNKKVTGSTSKRIRADLDVGANIRKELELVFDELYAEDPLLDKQPGAEIARRVAEVQEFDVDLLKEEIKIPTSIAMRKFLLTHPGCYPGHEHVRHVYHVMRT